MPTTRNSFHLCDYQTDQGSFNFHPVAAFKCTHVPPHSSTDRGIPSSSTDIILTVWGYVWRDSKTNKSYQPNNQTETLTEVPLADLMSKRCWFLLFTIWSNMIITKYMYYCVNYIHFIITRKSSKIKAYLTLYFTGLILPQSQLKKQQMVDIDVKSNNMTWTKTTFIIYRLLKSYSCMTIIRHSVAMTTDRSWPHWGGRRRGPVPGPDWGGDSDG